jgi:hypothetical protein
MEYNDIQKFFTEKNLHLFTFYAKANKPDNAAIMHLPGNTSAEGITVALRRRDYVTSVKQMTCQLRHSRRWVTHISHPLPPRYASKESKDPLCNNVIKVEVYRSQNGYIKCYNCQRSGHFWVQCSQAPPCVVGMFIAIVIVQRNSTNDSDDGVYSESLSFWTSSIIQNSNN